MQADESYQAVFQRLGQDEYDLTDLVKCLGDFDPVYLTRNFAESSDPFDSCFIASADYQDDTPMVKVKGNLKLNVAFWEHLGASRFIRDTIVDGYKIPFIYTPPSAHFTNNSSAILYSDFVVQAISDLLATGSVVECDSAPTVVNPLSVSVQSNGKKRLILDLRHPNYFVMKSKVRFDDAKTMLFSFVDSSQNWLFSFDIKSGYHHIDIFPPDQEFLGFSWFKDGFTHFYKFTVLPFGLSTGPYIFTKVMRPLVRYWRLQAFRIAVYLDDGLGVCPTFADCCSQSLAVKSDLFRAGFVANTQKSIWAPVQSLRWLGYCWDLKDNLLTVPEDKIDKLLVSIDNALSQSSLPARQLASVTGSIISNMLVFGNVCKLMTKSLHRALDRRVGWESRVDLDHAARKELEFWKVNVSLLNSRSFADAVRRPSRIVYSDASAVGCAAFIAIDDMPVSHKNWDSLQMKQSSTWRELHCVSFALKSFAHLLSGCFVKWFTDSQAVSLIVDSGSMKEHLNQLAVDIFHTAKEFNIEIEVEWIPRSLNEKADFLSKIVDFDDWTVKDCYFHAVNSYWGPCSVDCFASYKNHKIPRFYSRFFNPGSLGVDSLAFIWAGETCWLVPPVSLVKNVICHVCFCQCRGILVVPYWPSAPFWPFLVERKGGFRSFVLDSLFVENGKDVYLHGENNSTLFGSGNFSTPVFFLLLDGAVQYSVQ